MNGRYGHLKSIFLDLFYCFRFEKYPARNESMRTKGRYVFYWGRGGGPGLRRVGSSVKFLQIGEGQTCFVRSRGRVTLFSARKKLLHVA